MHEIIDPYGREAVKNTYGTDGRLEIMTDATGATVGLAYDLNTFTQTVTDQLGKRGAVQMDEHGNVIRETNQTGETTLRTFLLGNDGRWYRSSETQVIGETDDAINNETDDLTTTWEYTFWGAGFTGNPPRVIREVQTDSRGNKTTTAIDYQTGLPTGTTDSLGNTTSTGYDEKRESAFDHRYQWEHNHVRL